MMTDLPQHLRHVIESTHVAFEGLSHPLRIVSADADSADLAGSLRVTVEAVHNGSPVQASSTFDAASLSDERHVATTLAEQMREALSRRDS